MFARALLLLALACATGAEAFFLRARSAVRDHPSATAACDYCTGRAKCGTCAVGEHFHLSFN